MSLRHRRRRSLFFGGSDAYAVGVYTPPLVFDFASEFYRNRSAPSTFNNSLTYTGASAKTMVDSNGLVKWAPHNLQVYSQEFDNAAWVKGAGDVSVTANSLADPDGGMTMDFCEFTSTSADRRYALLYPSIITPVVGAKYRFAAWFRVSTGSEVIALGSRGASARFGWLAYDTATDTSLGEYTIGSPYSSITLVEATEVATDLWFMCVEVVANLYTTGFLTQWGATGQTAIDLRLDGNGTSGVGIWGAHFYRSNLGGMVDNPDRSDSYVPTTSAAVYLPRRGHHIYNGSTWVNEGIQLESEARTNLLTYSHEFDTVWTNLNSGVLTQDQTGPAGANTAWKFVDSGATGSGLLRIEQAVTVATTTTYTASVFAKADQLSWLFIQAQAFTTPASGGVYFNLTTGAVGTVGAGFTAHTPVNYGNGWWRCAITFTTDAADTAGNIKFFVSDGDGDLTVDYDGTSSILIYGAQFELGSTPSSYIPTAGATVTRSAETLTVAAANLPYSAVAMSIQMDGEMTYADEGANYQIRPLTWTNDSQNRIQHMIYTTGALTGEFRLDQESLNVADSVISVSELSPGINVSFNYAVRHGATFINAAFDGAAVTENSTPTSLPDLSAATLLLSPDAMGTIGKFRMWDEDLGDTGIATASARTYTTEFAMIVATTTASETFTIPCQNVGTFNAVIDWGDNSEHSTITAYNDADLVHTYNSPGDHVIRITGTFPNIYFNNAGDKLKVKSVENLGVVGWTRLDSAFFGCTNMTSFTSGTTDTSALVAVYSMFRDCSSLTSLDVSSLNIAGTTSLFRVFSGCSSLTSLDVSSFNTASVTNMSNTFRDCSSLTSLDVSSFNTAIVSNMNTMFYNCSSLTSLDVSSFNTASVSDMNVMFYNCSSVTDIIGVDTFDIGGLNSTGDLTSFATFVTLPTARYDALLLAWEAQDPFDGMAPNFGSSTYTGGGAVATARASLISRDGWTITDGGIA